MNVKINDSTQPTEINWDKPQLLEYTDGTPAKFIVLSTGMHHDSHNFEGLRLDDNDFSTKWVKQCFNPFNGTITLSND